MNTKKHWLWLLLPLLLVLAANSEAQNVTRPNIEGPAGWQVNSYTGSLFSKRQDMLIPGRGLPLDVTFIYNSSDRNWDGGFGHGWNFTYNWYYETDSLGIVLYRGDGREDLFQTTGNGFKAPKGVFDQFSEYEAGKYKLVTKEKTTYFFEDGAHKKLTRIRERNGNELVLGYNQGRIATITDGAQRVLRFTWSNNHLSGITAEAATPARTLQYFYNTSNNLTTVKDPLGNTTTYNYAINRAISSTRDRNGNALNVVYNSSNAVIKLISCEQEQTISYNSGQRKTYSTLKNGSQQVVTVFEFDEQGRLVQRSGNCCGFKNTFTYDPDNNINKIVDANGNTSLFTYDVKGNLLAETDALGKTILYTYDTAFSQVASITNKNGNKTTYTYDDRGNLTETHFPLDVVTKATYNAQGDRTAVTDGRNNSTTYTFDSYGYVATIINADGGVWTFTRDGWGNLLSQKDPLNNTATYIYDALNRVTKATNALNEVTTYTYDANSNISSITDARGNTTSYIYDAHNRPLIVTDAMGYTTRRGYDAAGNVIAATDGNGHTTLYQYDHLNRLISEANAVGETTRYGYDGNGNRVTVQNPNGNTVNYSFDALNRLTGISDILGQVAVYTYDANSNRLTETDGAGNTTMLQYDVLDRLVTKTDAMGHAQSFVYDKNDNLVQTKNRNGNTAGYDYDVMNRQTSTTDALGNITAYTYDKIGNQLTITDAKNQTTTYTYDKLNRNTVEQYADNSTRRFTYDVVGNLLTRTDQIGRVTTYAYDKLNRPVANNYPVGVDSFAYDAVGHIIKARNSQATVQFTFDAANRLASETNNGRTTGYVYNAAARTRRIVYPSGKTVERQMDVRDQLNTVTDAGTVLIDLDYDLAGRIMSKQLGNATGAVMTYNSNGLLTDLRHNPSRFVDIGISYDAENNPLEAQFRHRPANTEQYQYNKLNQLTQFRKGSGVQNSYTYDKVGNRSQTQQNSAAATYAVNSMNAYSSLTNTAAVVFSYDDNGNRTAAGPTTYTYDAENRLTAVNNGATATYAYDAMGRRVSKTAGGKTTQYYYDGLQVIEEYNGTGELEASYVWGTWMDDLVTMERLGARYYYHTNNIGSVVAVTNAAGKVVERYEYDAFGKVSVYDENYAALATSAIGNNYTFTGRQYEPETGLYFYRARHYDPVTGHFLQRDPLGYIDGMGMYAYVSNMPTTMIDPYGTFKIDWCNKWIRGAQWGLDVIGLVPVFGEWADGLNAGIYLMQGDKVNAALSAAGMIPFAGWGATGAKVAGKLAREGVQQGVQEISQQGVRGYRYMTEGELQAIQKTGMLRGGNPGETYFTKDVYKSAAHAQERLALPNTPTIRVEFEIVNNPTMVRNGTKVTPNYGMPGKGSEFMTTDQVKVKVINSQPLR
ncbi:MAG: RHS repeat protein [Niastella sp.]|nr:RHS repeat protein [Niastella sp.]